ncbi:MAG: phosphoribosylanthranilate isomerase [Pseudomonadota bacterium]
MMDMIVKICGLSTPESVALARDGGATHLGFIFYSKSPRHVSVEQAGALAQLKGKAETVAVTVNAEDDYLDEIVTTMKPDLLQLHGGESLERIAALRQRHGLPIIKAMAVREADDLNTISHYAPHVDLLLVDAKPPKGADLPGGNGVTFDWSLVENLASETPMLLSGGISMDNLDEAIGHVRNTANALAGLDLSSGVESAPGVKDGDKIKALLARCRDA